MGRRVWGQASEIPDTQAVKRASAKARSRPDSASAIWAPTRAETAAADPMATASRRSTDRRWTCMNAPQPPITIM